MVMHMLTSDGALSELAGAAEAIKECAKDDGMYSTSSTWRLGPLTTQATRLQYQSFVWLLNNVYEGRRKSGRGM